MFLSSERAEYITGAVIPVDGGSGIELPDPPACFILKDIGTPKLASALQLLGYIL